MNSLIFAGYINFFHFNKLAESNLASNSLQNYNGELAIKNLKIDIMKRF